MHNLKIIAKFILLSIITSSTLLAQNLNLQFNHLSVDEGLSQSTVFSIVEDKEGFIWFGTRDGLNRYDAHKMKIFRNNSSDSTSLSSNAILSLITDAKGNLWAGTSAGLNIYNPLLENFNRVALDRKGTTSIQGNHVMALLKDSKNNIWVGTREGLVLLPAGENIKSIRFEASDKKSNSLVNNEIRNIFEDKDGNIWIGTSSGLSKLTLTRKNHYQFTKYYLPNFKANQKTYNYINTIIEDEQGMLWLGTEKTGIQIFDKSKGKFTNKKIANGELDNGKIRVILKYKNKNYLIATIAGLYVLNAETQKLVKLSSNTLDQGALSDHSIRSLYKDKSGNLWVGTFYGGVNFYSPQAQQFHQIKLLDSNQRSKFKVASKILTDSAYNLWVGTEGAGLYYLDREENSSKIFRYDPKNKNSLTNDIIKTVMLEQDKLWIGTLNGLNILDLKTNKFNHYFHQPGNKKSLPDDNIYNILRDRKGTLWIATYNGGLSYLDEKNKVFTSFHHNLKNSNSLSSNSVTILFEDSKSNLWIGTSNGLNLKYPLQNKFKRFLNSIKEEQSLNGNYILCIQEDSHQRLWIGTQDGLNLLDPENGQVKRFTTADGLPGNTINGILEDNQGFLWVSTQNGLCRMDPKNITFQVYNKNDGLISKEFNYNSFHKDKRGYMYFGGYNGLVMFHPDSMSMSLKKPKLMFTKLHLFDQQVPINGKEGILNQSLTYTDQLTFRHDQNIFSVEFAVLNYINSNKNQFAYKLEGFDNKWNYVKEPVASYMNLEPGNYKLLVKGSNHDGIWNDTPQALAIKVLPPPWKSWWAYTIYCSIFVGLIFTWSWFNKSRLKLAHDLELEHLENIRQEELHQTKLNFFTNIAHEIRTPLTLILSPIQVIAEKYRNETFLQNQLSIVNANTNRLLRLLNQLLDFQKQETGNMQLKVSETDLITFLKDIELSFKEYAHQKNINFRLVCEYEELKMWFDAEELEKVFYNLITNAFKFSPNGGTIIFRACLEKHVANADGIVGPENFDLSPLNVRIIVEDNGIGISPEHLGKIFDRFYQVESPVVAESGFGIGLALTKNIVELHGGTIQVESREATEGISGFTRFIISLRTGKEHFSPNQIVASVSKPIMMEEYQWANLEYAGEADNLTGKVRQTDEKPTILLVEDNTQIRTYLKGILSEYYYIQEAIDGEAGWEIASEQLPDLIISDVSMPRMDGFELTKKLKSDERTNHIPVILLTARGAIIHQLEGLERGADEYISKPFNLNLLLIKIRNLLVVRDKLREKYSRIVTLQPQYQEIENPDDKFLQKLMLTLESNLSDADFNVSKLVEHIGMSRPVLFRKTKMLTGLSVIDLIRSVRLKKAEMLLKQKHLSISEVAYEVGFNDPKYFSKIFRSQYGKTPTEYVEQVTEL